jgi:chorismate lyase / 3-hydroxybenzoate synthase
MIECSAMVPVFSAVMPRYLPPDSVSPDAPLIAFGDAIEGKPCIPVPQLGRHPRVEVWDLPTGELYFGTAFSEGALPLVRETRELYDRILTQARAAGFPWFVRMWNHVGSINADEDGMERYRHFCAGRHEAFVAAGYHHGADLPAASAVGMRGRGLATYFLAAREPGLQIENPRQMAAYHYPPQYGPKSPSFSRATLWRDTLFVSGTSSVVGHESVHIGDLEAQLDETLRNIEVVIAQAFPGRGLETVVAAKTYIRRAGDYDLIARKLDAIFPSNLYLESDICRAELLLETEVVAVGEGPLPRSE